MSEFITALLLLLASVFLLLAGLAIVRMPDLFMRLSATSKAISLGATIMFVAAAVYFHEAGVAARAVAGIGFFLLTSPVAAHILGRCGFHIGTPFTAQTINVPPPPSHAEDAGHREVH
jgi:multicomponent Na+:H+ antiporter subunit G